MKRRSLGTRIGRAVRWTLPLLVLLSSGTPAAPAAAQGIEFPGPAPGQARARLEDQKLTLENEVIAASWDLRPGRFELIEVVDRLSRRTIHPGQAKAFSLLLADGRVLEPRDFRRDSGPTIERIEPEPEAVRLRSRRAGWKATVAMTSPDGRLRVEWSASLRDGANYIGQEVTIAAVKEPLDIVTASLIRWDLPGARVVGTVDGSPVVAGGLFFACEHPMAAHRVKGDTVVGSVPRFSPIRPRRPWTATSVLGVAPAGQLRRALLHYIERERARPYRPLAYYISWFDIAAPDRKMNQDLCLDRIRAFGKELVERRGVKLDAFVFDDGWDDNHSLWQFHSGFPEGFAPLEAAAAEYGAFLGTWISPWGGYGKAKAERLEYGKSQGFETNRHGFSLSGATYYERFRSVCMRQIEEYGVGYFKFDGVGPGNLVAGAGEEYGPDIEALLDLITDLRAARPGLFVNTTVG